MNPTFGAKLFDKRKLKQLLSEDRYMKWKQATRNLESIDEDTADAIAKAMKEWALEEGATHYCHWFQPLNGKTARKYDSFLQRSIKNEPIYQFSGKELIKNESDASSFPHGGMRSTFEARGYTYWDLTANSFIYNNILYIPCIFVSYTGETLDKKLPLLKSLDYLSKNATKLYNLISQTKAYRSKVKLGLEQEFFLIAKDVYEKRKDLKATGRTLYGMPVIKTQEESHHYFGVLPEKVVAFYRDVNEKLAELGIYVKTQHNEAAPAQFEMAFLYNDVNAAVDHNHLVMEILTKTAKKHDMVCLLHEKPFAKVNGSGKHNNYSIQTNEGENFFNPNGNEDLFFLSLLAVLRGACLYASLLRIASSNVNNDLRLGGSEAPPAIISVTVDSDVVKALQKRCGSDDKDRCELPSIHIDRLGEVPMDHSDRNRTSPFAFNGNKFEFRMLGSSVSPSDMNIALNTVIGSSFEAFYERLKDSDENTIQSAIDELIRESMEKYKKIIYNGDNYSDVWIKEAEKRGLKNYPTFLDALKDWEEDAKLYVDKGIFTDQELSAMKEIMVSETNSIYEVEARTMMRMVRKDIIPLIVDEIIRLNQFLKELVNEKLLKNRTQLNDAITSLEEGVKKLEEILESGKALSETKRSIHYRDTIRPLINRMADEIERCEKLIGSDLWTLPGYDEIFDSVEQ